MPSWDPTAYLAFADERSRAFRDLLARVGAVAPRTVVDLGCGPGHLTAELAERWPTATVLGVDSSAQMLQRAAVHAVPGRIAFERADLAGWTPSGPPDVMVANAVLHWVPEHLGLLPRWAAQLAPGGWLGVQVPGNFDAPSHALMRRVAQEPRFRGRLSGVLRGGESVADAVAYADVLAGAGCRVDAWETTYVHVLDPPDEQGRRRHGADAVLAWVSGTALRPVLGALDDDPALRDDFVTTYAELLRDAYPVRAWGTPLTYRRVFVVAQRR